MANLLNLSANVYKRRTLRDAPDYVNQSDIRPNIEVSQGARPFNAFEPNKYLPVKFKDTSTDDYVVLPVGRIVSAATIGNSVVNTPNTSNWEGETTAIQLPARGYETYLGVYGLLQPANHGAAQTVTYTTLDVTARVPSPDTAGSVVTAGDTYALGANCPIGVVHGDVYADIRGRNLNYSVFEKYGLLTSKLIELPFVNVKELIETAGVAEDAFVDASITSSDVYLVANTGDGYLATEKNYTFFYFNATNDNSGSYEEKGGVAGQLVEPDWNGCFRPASDSTLTSNKTVQTVGRLYVLDAVTNKSMLDNVQVRAGQSVTGSGTAGVEKHLYDFAKLVLDNTSYSYDTSKDTAVEIRELIEAGVFGRAFIQLNIR